MRGLCELHGGSVAARSDGPGTGATFTVRLPFAGSPAPTAAVSGPASGPEPGAGARILLVDDNIDTAAAMARLFTRRGYVIAQAHDGPAALDRAHEFSPAAVLLDIGLPGLDGYEVARRLRATPGGVGTLIIALSGYGQEEDRAGSRAAGFNHHLVKPVNFEELRALLARSLAAR